MCLWTYVCPPVPASLLTPRPPGHRPWLKGLCLWTPLYCDIPILHVGASAFIWLSFHPSEVPGEATQGQARISSQLQPHCTPGGAGLYIATSGSLLTFIPAHSINRPR